jgi:hypothetical protein
MHLSRLILFVPLPVEPHVVNSDTIYDIHRLILFLNQQLILGRRMNNLMCQATRTCDDARNEDAIHEFGVQRARFEDLPMVCSTSSFLFFLFDQGGFVIGYI